MFNRFNYKTLIPAQTIMDQNKSCVDFITPPEFNIKVKRYGNRFYVTCDEFEMPIIFVSDHKKVIKPPSRSTQKLKDFYEKYKNYRYFRLEFSAHPEYRDIDFTKCNIKIYDMEADFRYVPIEFKKLKTAAAPKSN